MENTHQALGPDPLERLSAVLVERLGASWVHATCPGNRAVTLIHAVTGRRIGADPYQGRIILQTWTRGADAFTPTVAYTSDLGKHEDLEPRG
ncbi:hypothetical protein [Streptomyces sp. NPDC006551]|uniref:hypothetical protein n=1 Tax=Streptomyces sp. NPDC006551 TaxID=3157178 RepID=UPI0033BA6ED7